MSHSATFKKEEKKKELNPLWRGIGCLTIVFVFGFSFWLSSMLIATVTTREFVASVRAPDSNFPKVLRFAPAAIRDIQAQFKAKYPAFGIGEYVAPFGLALVVSLLTYGIVAMVYAFARGNTIDSRDVRNYQPTNRKRRNVRKCR